uniref:Uncharacterized protein n=1 Tax=Anguilla anguilla TaxID=7936 RepID=A0A0E9XHH2_ANGAN
MNTESRELLPFHSMDHIIKRQLPGDHMRDMGTVPLKLSLENTGTFMINLKRR